MRAILIGLATLGCVQAHAQPAPARRIDQTFQHLDKDELHRKRTHGVSIGMNADDVLQSSWGKPERVNKTRTAAGMHEQWVYRNNYIYLDNGIVTAIQTSSKSR